MVSTSRITTRTKTNPVMINGRRDGSSSGAVLLALLATPAALTGRLHEPQIAASNTLDRFGLVALTTVRATAAPAASFLGTRLPTHGGFLGTLGTLVHHDTRRDNG